MKKDVISAITEKNIFITAEVNLMKQNSATKKRLLDFDSNK